MKSNLIFILLFLFFKSYSQDVDTIFYNEDGYYEIIKKINYDTIQKPVLLTEEFRKYTIAENKLIGQRQILKQGEILTELWDDNGVKYFEEYTNNNLAYQITWNNESKLKSKIVSNYTNKVRTDYYENNASIIKELIKHEQYNYSFDSLNIIDEQAGLIWIEQDNNSIFKEIPIKITQISFYNNSVKKSEKEFITKPFYAFYSKNDYLEYVKTNDFRKIIDKRKYIKHGIWRFYDEDANLISEKQFNNSKNLLEILPKKDSILTH